MTVKIVTIDELLSHDPDEVRRDVAEWLEGFDWSQAEHITVSQQAFQQLMDTCGIAEEELPFLTVNMQVKH